MQIVISQDTGEVVSKGHQKANGFQRLRASINEISKNPQSIVGRVDPPASGWTGFFVELTFSVGGPYPLKFTTEVRVLPDPLPYILGKD